MFIQFFWEACDYGQQFSGALIQVAAKTRWHKPTEGRPLQIGFR
jgi:hypothetical protein